MKDRVSTLIPYLSYSKLRSILPKKPMFTGVKRGKLPSKIRLIGYPEFGLFLDHYIRQVLSNLFFKTADKRTPLELYQDVIGDGKIEFSSLVTDNYVTEFILAEFIDSKHLEIEPEWNFEGISGHPDLVIDKTHLVISYAMALACAGKITPM